METSTASDAPQVKPSTSLDTNGTTWTYSSADPTRGLQHAASEVNVEVSTAGG